MLQKRIFQERFCGITAVFPCAASTINTVPFSSAVFVILDKPQEVTVNGQVYKDAEFEEDKKLHGTIVILKDVPADAQVKVTFAADAAVYQRDYAEEAYEILEKAQITYAQKTEVYKVVKELGTEAVPVLVSMNLNPSLLGVLMEILTMGI